MIKTIFFDLDGVIIDSEPIHAKAKKLTLDEYGIDYPISLFDDFIGQTDEAFFKHVSETLDTERRPIDLLLQRKQKLFVELLPEMKFVDGFLFFHQKVKEKGLKTALVSSTSSYTFELIDKIFNISHLVDLLVTEKDTVYHKPHPAPYLKALQTLPASTETTIVIEDSPNGIISAKKAGCKVFALTTSFKAEKLTDADKIFHHYSALAMELENP
ncbi:MAG: HAD family phosphatase [Tannerellaceae bacterium]|jgi:beta-phosphoglucomutase|nr:HAD family phosphatase [Tannerellaceae bacterium]